MEAKNPPKQAKQARMVEPGREEEKGVLVGGSNGEYREEMLAEMEKEVMMVSVLRCESELTLLEVEPQRMAGSVSGGSMGAEMRQTFSCRKTL